MTACAMSIGMVPMALALERGSQMEAPLGRAVIGGLVMSTFATLLVLPSVFALVIGKKQPASPSLYPGNPESAHYDPALGQAEGDGQEDSEGEASDGEAAGRNGKAHEGNGQHRPARRDGRGSDGQGGAEEEQESLTTSSR